VHPFATDIQVLSSKGSPPFGLERPLAAPLLAKGCY